MSLSWSQKLFLIINRQVGKRPWLDKIMYAIAQWLIYVLSFTVFWWGVSTLSVVDFKIFIKLILTAAVFGFVDNWLIALIWKHPRPIIQFPQIKTLFSPIENWKAFPSDHTTLAFVLVFVALFFHPVWWLASLLVIIGLLVGISRVYCGVHYPRDIVGGILFALGYTYLAFWLVESISQPVYIWIMNLFI